MSLYGHNKDAWMDCRCGVSGAARRDHEEWMREKTRVMEEPKTADDAFDLVEEAEDNVKTFERGFKIALVILFFLLGLTIVGALFVAPIWGSAANALIIPGSIGMGLTALFIIIWVAHHVGDEEVYKRRSRARRWNRKALRNSMNHQ